jgi:putative addiction module killer protein
MVVRHQGWHVETTLKKAQLGNLGDIKLLGNGIFEMREHFGAGYRMYYVQRGNCHVGWWR